VVIVSDRGDKTKNLQRSKIFQEKERKFSACCRGTNIAAIRHWGRGRGVRKGFFSRIICHGGRFFYEQPVGAGRVDRRRGRGRLEATLEIDFVVAPSPETKPPDGVPGWNCFRGPEGSPGALGRRQWRVGARRLSQTNGGGGGKALGAALPIISERLLSLERGRRRAARRDAADVGYNRFNKITCSSKTLGAAGKAAPVGPDGELFGNRNEAVIFGRGATSSEDLSPTTYLRPPSGVSCSLRLMALNTAIFFLSMFRTRFRRRPSATARVCWRDGTHQSTSRAPPTASPVRLLWGAPKRELKEL